MQECLFELHSEKNFNCVAQSSGHGFELAAIEFADYIHIIRYNHKSPIIFSQSTKQY